MKLLISLFWIFIIGLAVLGVAAFKKSYLYHATSNNVSNVWEYLKHNVAVLGKNVSEEMVPQRRRPFSLMAKKDKLMMFAPQAFREFTQEDWNDFWDLIYEHKEVGEGFIKQKVQRSPEEIQDFLSYEFPGFYYFTENNWGRFWGIILGKD